SRSRSPSRTPRTATSCSRATSPCRRIPSWSPTPRSSSSPSRCRASRRSPRRARRRPPRASPPRSPPRRSDPRERRGGAWKPLRPAPLLTHRYRGVAHCAAPRYRIRGRATGLGPRAHPTKHADPGQHERRPAPGRAGPQHRAGARQARSSPMTASGRPRGPYLVVGLGNPGPRYAATRHNIGQMVLDHIADAGGGRFAAARRAQAVVLEGRLGNPGADERVILAKTTTFMNVSGGPVKALAAYYDIPPARVVAVHDEVDIPFDAVRLKLGGGEGGHNGLRDITKALGTKDYLRVRVGVGRPTGGRDTADHVLAPFSATERKSLDLLVADAADAVESLILEGLTTAQQRFHSRESR